MNPQRVSINKNEQDTNEYNDLNTESINKEQTKQTQQQKQERIRIQQQSILQYIRKCYTKQSNSLLFDSYFLSLTRFLNIIKIQEHKETQAGKQIAQLQKQWKFIKKITLPKFVQQKKLPNLKLTQTMMHGIIDCQMKELQDLDLYNLRANNQCIRLLSLSDNFTKLKRLQLNQNNIDAKGMKYLYKANMPVLQRLFLGWDKIGNQGVKWLCKSNLPNLLQIALGSSWIGYDGNCALSYSNWKSIEIVWMTHNLKVDVGNLQFIMLKMNSTKLYLNTKLIAKFANGILKSKNVDLTS